MTHKLYSSTLTLENGTIYKGWSLNNNLLSLGEVVFNTGMTGYQEIMTDPSYRGQIIIFTYPEIGNTGINQEDSESQHIHIKGIIAKNICFQPSNWRSKIPFIKYLLNQKIPHIFGIDTRALTKQIRNNGAMNGCICSQTLNTTNIKNLIQKAPKMQGSNLVNEVTTERTYEFKKLNKLYNNYFDSNHKIQKQPILNIIIIDLGVKHNIIERLFSYGCKITVVPATSTSQSILSYRPDGIILSNGPGDPEAIANTLENIKQLISQPLDIPIFGICMGHQILSLALGGTTFKLKFGHRGINHPIGIRSKAEITSQNHGFAVKAEWINNDDIYITHMNLNDFTVAGIIHKNKPIFSVQYHPEASPGPHDSEYLFQYFIKLVKYMKSKNKQIL